jgi:hypothetical protein
MTKQPSPTPAAVSLWLKQLTKEELHSAGWIAANKRFHGITQAARPFLNAHYQDEKEREAAFDGLALALLTIAHFEDVEALERLLSK